MSEPVLPSSFDGSVVLDIGGTVGALVVTTPAGMAGWELHVLGLEPGLPSTHTLVRARELPGEVMWAGVFPGLPEGSYELLVPPSAAHDHTAPGAGQHEHPHDHEHEHEGHPHSHLDEFEGPALAGPQVVRLVGGTVTDIDWTDQQVQTTPGLHAPVGQEPVGDARRQEEVSPR